MALQTPLLKSVSNDSMRFATGHLTRRQTNHSVAGRTLNWVGSDWHLARFLAAFVFAWFLLVSDSIAQFEIPGESGGFALNVAKPVELHATYQLASDKKTGKLSITADIQPNWHLYSITQPKGGPLKTVLTVQPLPAQFKVTGEFEPDIEPRITKNSAEHKGTSQVEEHENKVTWTAPFEVIDPNSAEQLVIVTKVAGQTCSADPTTRATLQCIQISESIVATFSGAIPTQPTATDFRPEMSHVLWSGRFSPSQAKPGQKLNFELTAKPLDGYHIYTYQMRDQSTDVKPTLIVITKSNGWAIFGPEAIGEVKNTTLLDNPISYHEQPVTWKFSIDVPNDATAKTFEIRGMIGFQMCTESTCDMLDSVEFRIEVPVGANEIATSGVVQFESRGTYKDVSDIANRTDVSVAKDAGEWKNYPVVAVLCLAFLAGLILNIMPCVLPVIGLKIMSFMNQAGSNPGRVIMLNVVFSLGVISVFMLLATLAAFFKVGWGELYKELGFTVVMISVVFVFGLSFLGVWEIPLPGFMGSVGGKKEVEGFASTFFKGILTTFLATPCSGPLLIPAVVWAIAQPTWLTYLVFFCMGLGMASPYLVIGLFPKLVKSLPRPGNWMVTFKQFMGFVLMGTVVFFLSAIPNKFETSMLCLLVFLSVACWRIGLTSLAAELPEKIKAWSVAAVIVGVGVLFSFYLLIPQHELNWQAYSKATLDQLLSEGRTVFIDTTADWCGTCKLNEHLAINTRTTKQFFEKYNIVALKADNTENSVEINQLLDGLGNTLHGLPYYVLYRPGRPEPIHFNAAFATPAGFLSRLGFDESKPAEPPSTSAVESKSEAGRFDP